VLSHLNAEQENRKSDLLAMFSRSGNRGEVGEVDEGGRRVGSDPVLVISGLG